MSFSHTRAPATRRWIVRRGAILEEDLDIARAAAEPDVDGRIAVAAMAVLDGIREQLLDDEREAQRVVTSHARPRAEGLHERGGFG